MSETALCTAWHSNSEGLRAALQLLQLDLSGVSSTSDTERALAAMLSWHLSTSAVTPPTSATAAALQSALSTHVAIHGWDGELRLCGGGEHYLIFNEGPGVYEFKERGCVETRHGYRLSDLRTMSAAIG